MARVPLVGKELKTEQCGRTHACLLNHANCRIRQVINMLSSQRTLKASVKKAACVLHPKADTASSVTLQQGLLKAEVNKAFSFSQN